jgi:hypothetical protein
MPFRTLTKSFTIMVMCAVVYLIPIDNALSQDTQSPMTGHIFFGRMTIENNDQEIEGDDFEIKTVGVDAQKPMSQGNIQYGIEGGAFFSWDSEVRQFKASSGSGGGSASISVDISSILVDLFLGGYVAIQPAKWLRLYTGAGPMFIWARHETEPLEPTPEPYADDSESESGVGVGLYARTGLDIFITDSIGISAGARINETTLSFEDTLGREEVDIEGWQVYGGISVYF